MIRKGESRLSEKMMLHKNNRFNLKRLAL